MQKQILSLVLVLSFTFSNGFGQTKYSKLKIDLTKTELVELMKLGLEVDHGSLIPGMHLVNDFSDQEVELINQAGISYQVLVEDIKADYLAKKGQVVERSVSCEEEDFYDYETPVNYTYGSMGGYHTYDEMIEVMEEMHAKFPNLITPLYAVEDIKSWEDNDIVWLKISDNPETDEDEPEALYTALHHAREPNSLSQMIFYMWYLLENYETDEEVKFLVDNTEMYFMPCLNPDGYKYNEFTDPDGNGYWRKNRRPANDPSEVGVDLNRNYGYFWGFDDIGSSANPGSIVYRGPQAFSEPETQAVRKFCLEHDIKIALNYHTHGNLLIHPWGYNDTPTDEDNIFKGLGITMIRENDYRLGTATETVGYIVNGSSDDYMYGEDAEKDAIYAFTPEVGPGFWPQPSEIDQLNKACVRMNLNTAHLLLNYYDVELLDFEPIVYEREGVYGLQISKNGLTEGNISLSIISKNENLDILPGFQLISLDLGQTTFIPLNYFISEDASDVEEMSFEVKYWTPDYEFVDTYSFTYRNSEFVETEIDDFTDLNAWENEESTWGLTTFQYFSPPTSLTDSPDGEYLPFRDDAITLVDQISIEPNSLSYLKFNAWWHLEYNYDYVQVQVSTDSGENWTSLCGKYTRVGRQSSHGTTDPLIDGVSEWVVEEMDLTDYQGEIIDLRLVFHSDGAVQFDGFYIDDLIVVEDKVITGLEEELSGSNMFQINPSLNNGLFEVEIDPSVLQDYTKLEVLNIQGVVVDTKMSLTPKMTFEINDASSGTFVVKLYKKDGTFVTKKLTVIK